jgi:PIN domain
MRPAEPRALMGSNIQYLDFYRFPEGRDLLVTLQNLQAYIFVTVQIVEEVQRNKLQVVAQSQIELFEKLKTVSSVSQHLFDMSGDSGSKLSKDLNDISRSIKNVNAGLKKAALRKLQRISPSEDEVSKALTKLFVNPVAPTPEQIQRARERKERGNPPGKKSDPLGDQLTWEQLLSAFSGKSGLWVISKDKDFCTEHYGDVLLNPLLHRELIQVNRMAPKVYCFKNFAKGVDDFVKTTGVKVSKMLSEEKLQEIERAQDALPPRLDRMSINDFVANVDTRIRTQAFLDIVRSGESYPPRPLEPDKP